MTMTLARLAANTDTDLIGLHDLEDPVPVATDLVPQGDVIAIPWTGAVRLDWDTVPAAGLALVEGEHTHSIHGTDVGVCRRLPGGVSELAVALIRVPEGETGWLMHPEHGGQGLAAGVWEVRRQRDSRGRVAD